MFCFSFEKPIRDNLIFLIKKLFCYSGISFGGDTRWTDMSDLVH